MQIALALIVALAASTQRITGIGFALICTPFLVLMLGAVHGVLVVNTLCVVLNLVVLAQTWRDVDVRKIVLLVAAALLAIPVGHLVAGLVPRPVLMIGIGALLLGAIAMMRGQGKLPRLPASVAALIAGALSGFMNVTAGVGGPAIAIYARAQKWEQETFVASIQLYFLIVNTASVLAEDPRYLAHAPVFLLGGSLLAGSLVGHYSARRVPADLAKKGTIVLAAAGAVVTMAKGAALLWPRP